MGEKPKRIAKYLAKIPDPDDARKYNKYHIAVIIIHCLLSIALLSNAWIILTNQAPTMKIVLSSLIIAIASTILYLLIKKRSTGYLALFYLYLFGLIFGIENGSELSTQLLIDMGIQILLIAQVAFTKKKLFPFQNQSHNKKSKDGIHIFTKGHYVNTPFTQL
ncbi:hypothetical protein ABMA57_02420 [Saccharospirillum sp. HFRX-1]|uniref:hypothetical protein n=1 Tax=unclassified Saccharospirillum TaxID=2633430 RepID=UPI00371F9E50